MIEEQPNNAAGRLLAVLENAKRTRQRKGTVADGWANIFGIDVSNRTLLLKKLSLVMKLPSQIQGLVEDDDEVDTTLFLSWKPQVAEILGTLNLSGDWRQLVGKIDAPTIQALKFCNDRLKRTNPEVVPPEDSLDRLLHNVQALIEEVRTAGDLDTRLQQYLLTHLMRLEQAIQDYRLQGMEPLQEAVQAGFGAIVLDRVTYEKLKDKPAGRRYCETLIHAGTIAFATIVSSMLGTQQHEVRLKLPDEVQQAVASSLGAEGSGDDAVKDGEEQ